MKNKNTHANCVAAGFTIIELLIVVAIGLIMAAITIPATRSAIASYQLSAAVDSATGAIQTARYQAIMHGYLYQVDFNSTTNQYQLSSEIPPATTFSSIGNAVPVSTSAITMGVGTVNVNPAGHAILQFKPNGAIVVTSGQVTPLSFTIARNGTTKTITVSNYGSISVQ